MYEGMMWALVASACLWAVGSRFLPVCTRELHRVNLGDSTLVVRESRKFRELVSVGRATSVQARVFRGDFLRSGWPYIDGFHLGPVLVPDATQVLFLGGGAALGPRQFSRCYPEMSIDVVEVEPEVVRVAQEYFDLQASERLCIYEHDGRSFLDRDECKAYDLIIVDVFVAGSVPSKFMTREFFELAASRLRDGGVVIMNFIGALHGSNSGMLRALFCTLQTVFGAASTRLFMVPDLYEKESLHSLDAPRNCILCGRRAAAMPSSAALLDCVRSFNQKAAPGLPRIAELGFQPLTLGVEPLTDVSLRTPFVTVS